MPATKTVDLATHPLTAWQGPLGLPDFAHIGDDDFSPVFDAALKAHEAEIDAIAGNKDTPTIENTLQALELGGDPLDRVSSIFWCRAGAHTNDAIQALERDISPKMSRHFSAISMNERLFARIDDLYQSRESLKLDAETLRVLEKTWKGFVRSGAKLDAEGKKRLAKINEELSSLGTSFGQNVLADERDWALFLDEADLAGLPDFLKSSMAEAAEMRGQKGHYAITLSRSIYEPFSTFSERRDLREILARRYKTLDKTLQTGDLRGIGTEMTNLFSVVLGEIAGEAGASEEVEKVLERVPPSLRREFGDDIRKSHEIFQVLAFAPDEALGPLKEPERWRREVAGARDLLNRIVKRVSDHETENA